MQSSASWKKAIANYGKQIAELSAENQQLQKKIDQFKQARGRVRDAKSDVERLGKKSRAIKPSETWKGKRRKGFDKGKNATIPESAGKYLHEIESFEDWIDSEIKNLETKKQKNISSLFSLNANKKRAERAWREALAEERM